MYVAGDAVAEDLAAALAVEDSVVAVVVHPVEDAVAAPTVVDLETLLEPKLPFRSLIQLIIGLGLGRV